MTQSKEEVKPEKIIKFDLASDNTKRTVARKSYEIAKRFKDAGIKFKKLIPAASDLSIIQNFKLTPNNELLCLEINTSKLSEEEKSLAINDVKDHFLVLDEIKLLSDKPFMFDKVSSSHRFLFSVNKTK